MQFEELVEGLENIDPIVPPATDPTPSEDLDYFEVLKATNALTLPEDYEFVSLEKAIEDHRRLTFESAKQGVLDSVPPEFKEVIEYALQGGSSLTEFLDKTKTTDFENLDLEEVEDQKKVMYNYYKMTSKHDDEKIQRLISRLEQSGDLKSEAEETLEELINIKKENAKKLIESQKEAERIEKEQLEQRIKQINTSLEETNFSIERKNRIKSFIFTSTQNGSTQFTDTLDQVYSNPKHFIEFANFLANYHPSTGFDYDKLKKQIQTENVKNIKEIISEKLDARLKATGRSTNSIPNDFDWESYFSK